MMRKIKGQGALEYLLLIGGAVLIAVIVIALLVGMGGQSRETAQDQATKASKTLDQPQPATIVSITPGTAAACNAAKAAAPISMNWQKLGQGGIYTVKVYDYTDNPIAVSGAVPATGFDITTSASPTALTINIGAGSCNDTYWAEITTEKNGQKVTSTRAKWNW